MGTYREMKRHRDELFTGTARPLPDTPVELFRAVCAYVTESSGREVRLMLEPFPQDTVSGLWLDMGDFEAIVVEANTSPLHQMVIVGHELWHRKEGSCGQHGGAAGAAVAARMIGDRWSLDDAVARFAARTDVDLDEERRAEKFGRMLAAKFRPHLEGMRPGKTPASGVAGRIWASLEG
ncbi:toxin-antitoxin system, toxin component [Streptomyces sp. NBC_00868]|uniref:toxin-antitoxin system, toxin component n=2 Tax=Streptomyces TaxID=1883 RepID=UPI003249B9FF|nr:toxin-antitoxin system, toxin component [Streptomyces sp. NBC_00868]